jgi:hypothetical protein
VACFAALQGAKMFDELRYRWALRKHLKQHKAMYQTFAKMPDDDPEKIEEEARYKWV